MGTRPSSGRSGRPTGWRQGWKDANHGPFGTLRHELTQVGHVTLIHHVLHQLHGGSVHADDDGFLRRTLHVILL